MMELPNSKLAFAAGIVVNKPEAMRSLAASARHGNVEAMGNLRFMIVNGAAGWLAVEHRSDHRWLVVVDSVRFQSSPAHSRGTRLR